VATPPVADRLRIVRAQFTAAATAFAQCPAPVRSEVAFVGRSNVGKSSLLNALTGQQKLARTSSTPGCTRQLLFFDIETADKAALSFVDLPGYGYAKRSKAERNEWSLFAEDYLLQRPTLRAVVLLFDVRRGLEFEETELLKLLADKQGGRREAPTPLLTATKLDTLSSAQRKPRVLEIQKQAALPVLGTSVEDRDSIVRLWAKIRRSIGLDSSM
jgi:GTP-binding protein